MWISWSTWLSCSQPEGSIAFLTSSLASLCWPPSLTVLLVWRFTLWPFRLIPPLLYCLGRFPFLRTLVTWSLSLKNEHTASKQKHTFYLVIPTTLCWINFKTLQTWEYLPNRSLKGRILFMFYSHLWLHFFTKGETSWFIQSGATCVPVILAMSGCWWLLCVGCWQASFWAWASGGWQ